MHSSCQFPPRPGSEAPEYDFEVRSLRWLGIALGVVLALFLVVRGIVELFTIAYTQPASYRQDWGGPHLAGVLAVHTGPAVVVVVGIVDWVHWRKRNTDG